MGTYINCDDKSNSNNSWEFSVGSPYSMISQQFDFARGYANQSFNLTTDYMNQLSNILTSMEMPPIDDIIVDSPEIPDIDYGTRPSLGDVELPTDWPENNSPLPIYKPVPEFTNVEIPTLSITPPEYIDVQKPTMSPVTEPGDIPPVNEIPIPTAPSVSLPSPPTFDDIIMPASPITTVPEFNSPPPSMTINDPAPFHWGEPVYTSDIWTDLLNRVLDGIRNGGTGLDANVEAEIYQRLLDRQLDENNRLYVEAEEYFSSRGFPLPHGALVGKLTEIQNQISRNNSAASREITINQAELAQKNTQFILELGSKLEGMIRDFFTQGTNRLFEANKVSAENAILLHNALVEKHNAEVNKYEIEGRVYESRIKALLTEVEIFKILSLRLSMCLSPFLISLIRFFWPM